MGLPNGVHHLAIATRDMKGQIEFFTDVVGMELVALYWMHGVPDTVHGFLGSATPARSRSSRGRRCSASSRSSASRTPARTAGPVAPGAMQHVAFNVELGDRPPRAARPHPLARLLGHGSDRSRHVQVDVSRGAGGHRARVRDLGRADRRRPVDRSGGRRRSAASIAGELARYRQPAAFVSRNGEVAQPDHRTRPTLEFPPEMDSILTMSDEAIAETLDFPPAARHEALILADPGSSRRFPAGKRSSYRPARSPEEDFAMTTAANAPDTPARAAISSSSTASSSTPSRARPSRPSSRTTAPCRPWSPRATRPTSTTPSRRRAPPTTALGHDARRASARGCCCAWPT